MAHWPTPDSPARTSSWRWRRSSSKPEDAEIDILERPCHKFDLRPPGVRPDLIVIHFTATRTVEEVFDIFLHGPLPLSSHYLIADDGTVYRLVAEDRRAWHAGRSSWGGQADVNSRSIGIELRNGGCLTPAGDRSAAWFRTAQGKLYRPLNEVVIARGRHWEAFAEAQMAALSALCRDIAVRHDIPPGNMVGHEQVALPPGRKIDPGPLFDWERLRH